MISSWRMICPANLWIFAETTHVIRHQLVFALKDKNWLGFWLVTADSRGFPLSYENHGGCNLSSIWRCGRPLRPSYIWGTQKGLTRYQPLEGNMKGWDNGRLNVQLARERQGLRIGEYKVVYRNLDSGVNTFETAVGDEDQLVGFWLKGLLDIIRIQDWTP